MLIVGYGLDVIATFQSGELATRAVLYVWLFITIPAGVSVVVNLLARPCAPQARRAGTRLARCAWRPPCCADPMNAPAAASLNSCARGAAEIQGWLKLAGVEKTSPPRDLAALRQATQSTTAILAWVDVVDAHAVPGCCLGLSSSSWRRLSRPWRRCYARGAIPLEIALEAHIGESPLPAYAAELWAEIRSLLHGFAEPPGA